MSEIPKMLNKRPEMAASLSIEKTERIQRIARNMARCVLLKELLAETEAQLEEDTDRIGAINDFLAEPDGTPAA